MTGATSASERLGRVLAAHPGRPWHGLLDLVEASGSVHYGEDVTMLEHAVQTATVAEREGASPSLVVAALLHDVGHLLGEAGDFGLPDHARVAGEALATVLPPEVVEPIRLHVEAKRYLVSTEPGYAAALSHASTMTLLEQGGALDPASADAFAVRDGASDAIRLRRWDDLGKVEGLPHADPQRWASLVRAECDRHLRRTVSARWLRDACRCSECRDPGTDQHLLAAEDLDGWQLHHDGDPIGLSADELDVVLAAHLRRDDGTDHVCRIPRDAFAFSADPPASATGDMPPGIIAPAVWDATFRESLDRRAGSGRQVADRVIVDLATRGLALQRHVPIEPGRVIEFARQIGYVRETNYGQLFDVVVAPDPTNLAYTAKGLPLHTDNPYRRPCPSVQLLHCLAAADGGESLFSDGFRAAAELRQAAPDAFAVLAETAVTFRYRAANVHLETRRPIIEVDADGAVRAVNVNHRSMEPPVWSATAAAGIDAFAAAYRRFVDIVSDERALIRLKLEPGDCVLFDNRRVLHGRGCFQTDAGRHLQGCYIDMDAVQSRARLLATPS